jgi:predicted phosphodiesterase
VEFAVREKADAVLIAGDLVESSTAYYEAFGPLIEGFRKLQEKGIDIFAVAGNHDSGAFEKIAAEVEGMERVHFVGRRGVWERVPLIRDGAERMCVDGWSFPAPRHLLNPVDHYNLPRPDANPVIGLLHTDLNVAYSPYAPTSSESLLRCPPDFWLLGHVHKPQFIQAANERGFLHPGSPQAMDFGETGAHGVWVLDTSAEALEPKFSQLSTVRFEESIRVKIEDADEADQIEQKLLACGRSKIDDLPASELHELRCVVHRCALAGEFSQPQVISGLSSRLPELVAPRHGEISICFDGRLRDETSLPLDIEALERRGGALGELASRFRQLRSEEWREAAWFLEIHEEVVQAYRGCLIEGDGDAGERNLTPGRTAPPDEGQTHEWLVAQAKQLLVAARDKLA